MLALLLNTCGAEGIVALANESRVLAEERLPMRGTSEALMPAIARVLGGVRVRELGAVGVVLGPGSFTGSRVGLAAAKGLCEAGGVGLVGMSRLGLVAAEAGTAVLDAGRAEFYCGDGAWERLLGREELDGLNALGGLVSCEARVVTALGDRVRLVAEPGAAEMMVEVVRRVGVGAWSDVASVDANYLRRTDAEVKIGS